MGWYALIGLLAILILVIENFDILFRGGDSQMFPDMVVYRKFLFGVLSYYVTDTLWGVLDSMHLTPVLYVDTVIYYVTMAVGVLLWTRYVVGYLGEDNIFSRILLHAGRFFFAAVVIITIVNCFTPILFWFDEGGTYHACPARHAQLEFQIVMLLLTSAYTFRVMIRTKEEIRKRYHTIFLFGLVVALLLTIQLKYPFLPLYTIGYMLGTCLLHIFVVGNEIDEYRRLRRESEVAIAANKAKSAFLSNMSHEIRTPINAVLGMNEMILRESSDETILEYSENIRSAGKTLLGLINDILDFSKIESGKLDIVPVDYDLSSVLGDLVNMVQTRADEKGLVLVTDFDSNIPKLLNGDEIRIKQIITNILTNAVKYTEKGSITFKVGCEEPADDPDAVILKVKVSDTGIGIRQEDMDKLFSEFERIEEGRNRYEEGTGLGMSITRSLLAMMGSSLKVESEYGKGSVFFFDLRQKVVNREPLGDYETSYKEHLQKHRKYREKFTAPDAHILVVDDNPMNLVVFKGLVKQSMMMVDTAEDGDTGLSLAKDTKFDLIFMDHMMPGKNGIETLKELKAQTDSPNASTPVVCLTANAVSGARETYISSGFDDYLTKPIDAVKLEEMLLTFLPEEKVKKTVVSEEESTREEGNADIPPELSKLDEEKWIDVNSGIKNSGSIEAYIPVLRIFYNTLNEKADELERLFSQGDLENYTIKVHALKSSARIIGASGFGEKAQKLEDAGKIPDIGYIKDHNDSFIEEYRSFREPLASVFKNEDDETDRPVADPGLMEDAIDRLRAAADDMDCDMLQAIFGEMDKYRVPYEYTDLWKSVGEASSNYDYERIMQLIDARR